eukprot:scaffold53121_cov43-Prasinocladus_malaysianus.AAC.1
MPPLLTAYSLAGLAAACIIQQGTGKRTRAMRVHSPPRRFNHELGLYPRLLDPGLAPPGVKSIGPPKRNPLTLPPPEHSMLIGSGNWGLAAP